VQAVHNLLCMPIPTTNNHRLLHKLHSLHWHLSILDTIPPHKRLGLAKISLTQQHKLQRPITYLRMAHQEAPRSHRRRLQAQTMRTPLPLRACTPRRRTHSEVQQMFFHLCEHLPVSTPVLVVLVMAEDSALGLMVRVVLVTVLNVARLVTSLENALTHLLTVVYYVIAVARVATWLRNVPTPLWQVPQLDPSHALDVESVDTSAEIARRMALFPQKTLASVVDNLVTEHASARDQISECALCARTLVMYPAIAQSALLANFFVSCICN